LSILHHLDLLLLTSLSNQNRFECSLLLGLNGNRQLLVLVPKGSLQHQHHQQQYWFLHLLQSFDLVLLLPLVVALYLENVHQQQRQQRDDIVEILYRLKKIYLSVVQVLLVVSTKEGQGVQNLPLDLNYHLLLLLEIIDHPEVEEL
jgi:hypothetical protein